MNKNKFFLITGASTPGQVRSIVELCSASIEKGRVQLVILSKCNPPLEKKDIPQGVLLAGLGSVVDGSDAYHCFLATEQNVLLLPGPQVVQLGYIYSATPANLIPLLERCARGEIDGIYLHDAAFATAGYAAVKLTEIALAEISKAEITAA